MLTNQIQLRFLFDIFSGSTPETGKDFYWDGDIAWITPEDISILKEKYLLSDTKRKITDEGFINAGLKLAPKDAIVFTKRAPIGNLALLNIEACCNQGCFLLVSKDKTSSLFFYYYLLSQKKYLQVLGRGSTFMELSLDEMKSLKVPYLSTKQQLNIVNYLSRETKEIDEQIELKEKQITLLNEKRQALITQAVTRGLNPNVKLKDSGVNCMGEIPEHWGVVQMKYLASEPLKYGANEAALDDNINNPRFIRITDINNDGSLKEDTFKSLEMELAKDYLLDDGDVLFARSGATVGKAFLYKKEWGVSCFAGYLIRMRCNRKKILPEYLILITESNYYWRQIYSESIQATIQNFSGEKYSSMKIILPDIKEQGTIISFLRTELNKLEGMSKLTEKTICLLKERRTALISAAVTGQINIDEIL